MTDPQPFQPLLLPIPSLSLELVPLSIAIELKTRLGHASFQYIDLWSWNLYFYVAICKTCKGHFAELFSTSRLKPISSSKLRREMSRCWLIVAECHRSFRERKITSKHRIMVIFCLVQLEAPVFSPFFSLLRCQHIPLALDLKCSLHPNSKLVHLKQKTKWGGAPPSHAFDWYFTLS